MDAVTQYLTHTPWESKLLSSYPATSYAYYVGDYILKSQTL